MSAIEEISVDLDEDSELEKLRHVLTPEEFKLVKAERDRRRRYMGPNGEIITSV